MIRFVVFTLRVKNAVLPVMMLIMILARIFIGILFPSSLLMSVFFLLFLLISFSFFFVWWLSLHPILIILIFLLFLHQLKNLSHSLILIACGTIVRNLPVVKEGFKDYLLNSFIIPVPGNLLEYLNKIVIPLMCSLGVVFLGFTDISMDANI